MDHKNLIGHDGAVHEGLLNSHTGFLIDVACDAGRYSVVHHYEHLDRHALPTPRCPARRASSRAHPPDRSTAGVWLTGTPRTSSPAPTAADIRPPWTTRDFDWPSWHARWRTHRPGVSTR